MSIRKLVKQGQELFGDRYLRHKWVRAKIYLGDTIPRTQIGRLTEERHPRTLREATGHSARREEFLA